MNAQAIRILFLKDLFLSRRQLFAYVAAGLVCSVIAALPNKTIAFTGSILVITVAIAAGFHLIGMLLLGEAYDHTRLFVMTLPVSLFDYSLAKIAVILTTYLIPWCGMLACSMILGFVLPGAKHGAVAVMPVIFLYFLSTFTLQLIAAVITESFGVTICVVIACNVFLNVLLTKLYAVPEIAAVVQSDALSWPPLVLQLMAAELLAIGLAIAGALFFQMRKRDLV